MAKTALEQAADALKRADETATKARAELAECFASIADDYLQESPEVVASEIAGEMADTTRPATRDAFFAYAKAKQEHRDASEAFLAEVAKENARQHEANDFLNIDARTGKVG